MQSVHMTWKSRVNKTWRLFHVDFFSKNSIEKSIMNIELVNLSITRNCNGED
jgi:hypothetical protein